MNRFIQAYDKQRSRGRSEFESLGHAALHIRNVGNMNDLKEVVQHFNKDVDKTSNHVLQKISLIQATEFERKQREAGHKNSDFMGGF